MEDYKILIVEDELLVALDIKEILQEEGYKEILTTETVEKAIAIIESQAIDLVLIDIRLNQETDGIDLGHYLIKKDTIPFVYLTALSDKMTIDRAKYTRPYGYIVKPFKPEDLITTVYMVLNNYSYNKIDVLRKDEELTSIIPFKIKETINYIVENISEKIEISTLASLTPWKEHHYIRIFTKYLGITPYQYILKCKMDKAKALLTETVQPINEIAYDLGFKDYSNFCKAFKKSSHNETPENYRIKQQIQKYKEI